MEASAQVPLGRGFHNLFFRLSGIERMSLLDALELPLASQYRARASQLEAEASMASDDLAVELIKLAASYIRLSEFAELH